MAAKTIVIQESEANWSELLSLVREGKEIILMEGAKPIARLSPAEPSGRIPDLHPGGWISDDFDAPLPDPFWLGEE